MGISPHFPPITPIPCAMQGGGSNGDLTTTTPHSATTTNHAPKGLWANVVWRAEQCTNTNHWTGLRVPNYGSLVMTAGTPAISPFPPHFQAFSPFPPFPPFFQTPKSWFGEWVNSVAVSADARGNLPLYRSMSTAHLGILAVMFPFPFDTPRFRPLNSRASLTIRIRRLPRRCCRSTQASVAVGPTWDGG